MNEQDSPTSAGLLIAVAAIINPITVVILNLYQGDTRNKVMGWRGSANSVGGIVWPLVGSLLGEFSRHVPFGVYAVGIPPGVLALVTVPEARPEARPHPSQGGPVWVVLLISFALWAIGYTAVSRLASPLIIALAAAFFGIGQGMTMPALMVWVGDLVSAPFRGRVAAYLGMFGSLGQFLAPILFGTTLRFVELDGIFGIAGGICTLVFLPFWIGTGKRRAGTARIHIIRGGRE